MKSIFYTFLITILPFLLQAQNYQSVNGSDKYFARTTQYADYDNIIAIHIDSVQTAQNGDIYYFPYRIMRDTSFNWDECVMDTAAPSFAGKQITIKSNGDNFFLNRENKELVIKTGANLNEVWDFAIIDDVQYKAKITGISLETIGGITDSIKTIELQAFDLSGNPVENLMTGKELLLSKEHGLLSVLNFYEFPEDTAAYYYTDYQPLTWGDIYNFEIGDYFIYIYHHMDSWGGGQINYPPNYKVVEIQDIHYYPNHDSVTLTQKVRYINNVLEYYPEPHFIVTVSDTVLTETVNSLNDRVTDYFPHQHTNFPCSDNYFYISNSVACSNYDVYSICDNISHSHDCDFDTKCYHHAFEGIPYYFIYSEGLGQTHYYREEFSIGGGLDEWYLQYYRKGTKTWGDPTILSTPESVRDRQLIIAPNPAENEIKITLPSAAKGTSEIEIIAPDGRKEMKTNIVNLSVNNTLTLNISTLPSGLHFLVLKSGNEVYTVKFIKK